MSRDYSKVSKVNQSKAELLQCFVCNKKYKTELKRQKHVTEKHYYATRNSNIFNFDHELKAKLYYLAKFYIGILFRIISSENPEPSDEETEAAKKLLPQLYGQKLDETDLKRIIEAQRLFAKRLFAEGFLGIKWELVMNDFEKFFQLGLPYYDTNFCPTLLIDFLWHATMQDPILYKSICEQSCTEIMPHCNNPRTEAEDQARHKYFLAVFHHLFRRDPYIPPKTNQPYDCNLAALERIFINLHDFEVKQEQQRQAEMRRHWDDYSYTPAHVIFLGNPDNHRSLSSSC